MSVKNRIGLGIIATGLWCIKQGLHVRGWTNVELVVRGDDGTGPRTIAAPRVQYAVAVVGYRGYNPVHVFDTEPEARAFVAEQEPDWSIGWAVTELMDGTPGRHAEHWPATDPDFDATVPLFPLEASAN